MGDLRLDGVRVVASYLTQRSFRAAYCDLLLNVTRANQKAALAEFRRVREFDRFSGLRVSGISDLSFLAEFPRLLYLEVVDKPRVDMRPLDGLTNLRGLRVETPGTGIDFACFPELEVYIGDWHPDHRGLDKCHELRQLRVWQFKPPSHDLADLQGLPRLEYLQLSQTTITSLAGLERLEDLRYLEVAYAPTLESLTALAAPDCGIRELSLAKAKAIASYDPIAKLSYLRRLKLSGCAPLPDLKWMGGLRRLDFFSFVDTNVLDGDLSPLLALPKLRYVGTMDKRNYSHKMAALNAALPANRGP